VDGISPGKRGPLAFKARDDVGKDHAGQFFGRDSITSHQAGMQIGHAVVVECHHLPLPGS
jgi:hypothetical protein